MPPVQPSGLPAGYPVIGPWPEEHMHSFYIVAVMVTPRLLGNWLRRGEEAQWQ